MTLFDTRISFSADVLEIIESEFIFGILKGLFPPPLVSDFLDFLLFVSGSRVGAEGGREAVMAGVVRDTRFGDRLTD
jgi:hypothetical protein